MNVKDIIPAYVTPHLADGLKEGESLDVAHRAPHVDNNPARLALPRHLAATPLYLIGDMRHHLDGATEKHTLPLLSDDGTINLPGGHTGGSGKIGIDEAFVMTQVEVSFSTILGNVDLAMLIRRHRTWIDIDVRVQFLNGDRDITTLQNLPYGCGSDTLPYRANYTTSYKYILGQPSGSLRGKHGDFYRNSIRKKESF